MSTLRRQRERAGLTGLAPGDHVCYVIGSEDEFEADTVQSLAEGHQAGQKLFRFIPAVAIGSRSDHDPRVNYADPAQAFLGGGPLVPEVMLSMFAQQTAVAHREGFSGIRLVADMDWLLGHPPTPEQVAAYEQVLDKAVAELGATVVCAYRPGSFGPGVAEALAVHPQNAGADAERPLFRIWYADDDSWHVSGEIDLSDIDAFERALQTAASAGPVRTIRCADLTFISAAGLAVLSRLAATQPHPIIIEDAPQIMQHCWHVLGMDELQPHVTFRPARTAQAAGRGDRA